MNLSLAKQVVKLIIEFQNKNYFHDNERVQTQINNRDYAINQGQKVDEKYTDEYITKFVERQSRNESFTLTASVLYQKVKDKNLLFLKERLRYDQKFSLELFEMFTGIKLKGLSNKKIEPILVNYCQS